LVRGETQPRVTACANVYSDRAFDSNEQDEDYLSFGVWAAVTENPKTEADFQIGAFGSRAPKRIPPQTLLQVEDQAIYTGNATGIHTEGQALSYFDADVKLTADFDNAMTMGTIAGSVNQFRDKDGISLNIEDVMLEQTMIDGVFTGKASQKGVDQSGSWKGAFAGTNDMTGQPTGVSGTFGVGDLIGAFGAREFESGKPIGPRQ